jgi:hypothetical protein
MSVIDLRAQTSHEDRTTTVVTDFLASVGSLRLDAIKTIPTRALDRFPVEDRERLFGALKPADRVVVANLTHLSGAHRGEAFSVGLILAGDADGGQRVARLFDAVPLADTIDRLFGAAS